jgi:hypothetical protein
MPFYRILLIWGRVADKIDESDSEKAAQLSKDRDLANDNTR